MISWSYLIKLINRSFEKLFSRLTEQKGKQETVNGKCHVCMQKCFKPFFWFSIQLVPANNSRIHKFWKYHKIECILAAINGKLSLFQQRCERPKWSEAVKVQL